MGISCTMSISTLKIFACGKKFCFSVFICFGESEWFQPTYCHRSEPDGERGWQSLLHARILDTHLEFLCARLFVSYVPADMISRNVCYPVRRVLLCNMTCYAVT